MRFCAIKINFIFIVVSVDEIELSKNYNYEFKIPSNIINEEKEESIIKIAENNENFFHSALNNLINDFKLDNDNDEANNNNSLLLIEDNLVNEKENQDNKIPIDNGEGNDSVEMAYGTINALTNDFSDKDKPNVTRMSFEETKYDFF